MPRYYFHVRDGRDEQDTEGAELSSWGAAVHHAMSVASTVLKDHAHLSALGMEWFVEVTNEVGLTLFRLNLEVMPAPVLKHSEARQGRLP